MTIAHALERVEDLQKRTKTRNCLLRAGVSLDQPLNQITALDLVKFLNTHRSGKKTWKDFVGLCSLMDESFSKAASSIRISWLSHTHLPVDEFISVSGTKKAYCADCGALLNWNVPRQIWLKQRI